MATQAEKDNKKGYPRSPWYGVGVEDLNDPKGPRFEDLRTSKSPSKREKDEDRVGETDRERGNKERAALKRSRPKSEDLKIDLQSRPRRK
jgi:hypothetical protein